MKKPLFCCVVCLLTAFVFAACADDTDPEATSNAGSDSDATDTTSVNDADIEPDGTAHDAGSDTEPGDTSDTRDTVNQDAADTTDVQSCDPSVDQCCPGLVCEAFDFVADSESAQSNFDPATDILTVHLVSTNSAIVTTALQYTVMQSSQGSGSSSGSGTFGSVDGAVDGTAMTYDLSNVEVPEGYDLRLDAISLENDCDESNTLYLGEMVVDPDGSTTVTDLSCEERSFPF